MRGWSGKGGSAAGMQLSTNEPGEERPCGCFATSLAGLASLW